MNNLEKELLEIRDILYQFLEAVESYSIITELREIKIEAVRIRTVEYFNNLISKEGIKCISTKFRKYHKDGNAPHVGL